MSYATNPDLADARLRIAELERQLASARGPCPIWVLHERDFARVVNELAAETVAREKAEAELAAKPLDDVVSVIAKWTAKYGELRERLCEAEAELARLSAREGDAERVLAAARPGWTEEEVADAIRAMGAELAEERAVWEWLEQRRTEAIKKWHLTRFLPTVLLLHQYCAPPRDNVVQLAEVQPEQTIRAAIDKARKGL